MAISISASLTAAGTGSNQLFMKHGESFLYSITGTFVATWLLQMSQNGGITWKTIASGTSTSSNNVVQASFTDGGSGIYRVYCLAYTSGTITVAIASGAASINIHGPRWSPAALTTGTSTTPGATTVYLTPIYVIAPCVLTGVAISNGETVGTDKYIAAIFDATGAPLGYSALAGTTTSGDDVFQTLALTASLPIVAPQLIYVGLYVNGTTDRFRSIPAAGAQAGYCGSVGSQTFGTVANVALPTTFTADKGPVCYVY